VKVFLFTLNGVTFGFPARFVEEILPVKDVAGARIAGGARVLDAAAFFGAAGALAIFILGTVYGMFGALGQKWHGGNGATTPLAPFLAAATIT
jgi:hypothetical protein